MRVERVEWSGAEATAAAIRASAEARMETPDVSAIGREVAEGGDSAVLAYTARFDATDTPPERLAVDPAEARRALERLDSSLRASLELAAGNIRRVAEAQVSPDAIEVRLPEGQEVTIREVPVGAAGVYAPGGRASYPSSVLMCALPARAAGVERVALASPPGPDGSLDQAVLAAAAIAGVDEIFAMGGAQAVFALAYGTESVAPVDVIVGPGNAWVQEAKRAVYGRVGIDSYAGPSELMALLGHDGDARWAALDLCAQAEHGGEGLLVAASVEEAVLDAVAESLKQLGAERPGLDEEALVSLVQLPDLEDGVALANAIAPEHLELLDEDRRLAERVRTAGCVFLGRHGATAFGDYAAGSNHVLPTGGAGRFSGPLGPGVFRRRISIVEVSAEAAAKLAPHVDTIARAEGFPVHGESAMIRTEG